jgi:lysophospholipase L1-like esterase
MNRPLINALCAIAWRVLPLMLAPTVTLGKEMPHWIATWQSNPTGEQGPPAPFPMPPSTFFKGTLRYRVRVSAGGAAVRLRFSNEYSDVPLQISAVSVGVAGMGLDTVPDSLRAVTFGGEASITVPGGAPAITDPVQLIVSPLQDLIVSVYLAAGVKQTVCRAPLTRPDEVGIAGQNATQTAHLTQSRCLFSRPLVSEIDVRTEQPTSVIAAFGDSITDGSIDPATGDRGWPGALSRLVVGAQRSVVNDGISGNRLLASLSLFGAAGLARLDRDVLVVPGLRSIIVLEGINDIGQSGHTRFLPDSPPVRATDLIAAYQQIIARAHQRGIRVWGCTILPFEGAFYYTAAKEDVRRAVNDWIRHSGRFDRVVDLDVIVRDPSHPQRLRFNLDSGDHLHPNQAGFRAMAAAIAQRLQQH